MSQEKKKLAVEIERHGEKRQLQHRQAVEDYEEELRQSDGRRHSKRTRKTIETSSIQTLEGRLRVGNFWPEDVYEAHFKKNYLAAQ